MTLIRSRRYISALAFLVLGLASCDSAESPSSVSFGSSQMSMTAPGIVARAVDVNALFAEVTLTYDTNSGPFVATETAFRTNGSPTWDLSLDIPVDTQFVLDIVWYDMVDPQRVDLTSLTRSLSTVGAGETLTLTFDFSEFDFAAFNLDDDQFSNLEERINGTSPFVSDDGFVLDGIANRYLEGVTYTIEPAIDGQAATPVLQALWRPAADNPERVSTCESQPGFDVLLAADTLAEACTSPENCSLDFDQVSANPPTDNNLEFSLEIPSLQASVGLFYELETINSAQQTRVITYELCLIAVNEAPVAVDDSFTVVAGAPLEVTADQGVNLLSNDTDDIDVSNTALAVNTTPVRAPALATSFTLRADGGFSYLYDQVATAGAENLSDSFEYAISDGTSTSTATATIEIVLSDEPPEQTSDIPAQSVVVGVPAELDLSVHFADPENSELSFNAAAGTLPPSGGLSVSNVGLFSGVAQTGDEGTYSVEIVVRDRTSSVTASLALEVARNQRPIASPIADLADIATGQVISIDAGQSFSDPEGVPLDFSLETSPVSGLQINQGTGLISGQIVNPGVYTATVLASDRVSEPVSSSFTISVVQTSMAMLSETDPINLSFSAPLAQSATDVVRFSNQGDIQLDFSVSSDQSWLSADPVSGSLAAGESAELNVSVVCGQSAETLSGTLTIDSNGGSRSVPVTLECTRDEQPSTPQDDVANVQINGIDGSYFLGTPPQETGSLILDPLMIDTNEVTIIPGGSILIPMSARSAFSDVYVVANNASIDASGYFRVMLPQPVLEAEMVLTYKSDLAEGSTQRISAQVGSSEQSVSNPSSLLLQTAIVGTGDLQVSVSWDRETDVDLYLEEPGGETIFFGRKRSAAGGVLDLDSNVACFIDGIKNENITYEDVTPPSGTYTVSVRLFSDCGIPDTNYVVTVRNGGITTTFQGTLNSGNDRQEVTTFEVTTFEVR